MFIWLLVDVVPWMVMMMRVRTRQVALMFWCLPSPTWASATTTAAVPTCRRRHCFSASWWLRSASITSRQSRSSLFNWRRLLCPFSLYILLLLSAFLVGVLMLESQCKASYISFLLRVTGSRKDAVSGWFSLVVSVLSYSFQWNEAAQLDWSGSNGAAVLPDVRMHINELGSIEVRLWNCWLGDRNGIWPPKTKACTNYRSRPLKYSKLVRKMTMKAVFLWRICFFKYRKMF